MGSVVVESSMSFVGVPYACQFEDQLEQRTSEDNYKKIWGRCRIGLRSVGLDSRVETMLSLRL